MVRSFLQTMALVRPKLTVLICIIVPAGHEIGFVPNSHTILLLLAAEICNTIMYIRMQFSNDSNSYIFNLFDFILTRVF